LYLVACYKIWAFLGKVVDSTFVAVAVFCRSIDEASNMPAFPPANKFVKELGKKKSGQLQSLRRKLEILNDSQISKIKLSEENKTFKIIEKAPAEYGGGVRDKWVVKFSPVGNRDPWYDVKKEYRILCDLQKQRIAVPQPLYCSNKADKMNIGTDFIVMEYVEGKHFRCIGDIPKCHQREAVLSVARFLGTLHNEEWEEEEEVNYDSWDFWKQQIGTWKENFDVGCIPEASHKEKSLINNVSRTHPPVGVGRIIHGDMTISNVIFDDEYNVIAVVDWKYKTNGDPMADLGYFLMMFLKPKGIKGLEKLLAGDSVDEDKVLREYWKSRRFGDERASVEHVNFAKAVSCLRLMSIVKVAETDDFVGHECKQYVTKHTAPKVLKFIASAGVGFCA
jgi:aminoglycoside phosphotransferase (APT) family kinase protein